MKGNRGQFIAASLCMAVWIMFLVWMAAGGG
jgi:hypothetical protein